MSEMVIEATGPTYRDFIREVFIEPIRTTVVIDDEYPTMQDFLNLPDELASKADGQKTLSTEKRQNKETVKKIIGFCRDQRPTPWLIDIHDATGHKTIEQDVASHFDHTDLLILDYHLDKTQGSERSIGILRKLAGNRHFNLVAVYTKDRELTAGIDSTICDIALSLASPCEKLILNEKSSRYVAQKLEEWGNIDEGIYEKLLSSLDKFAFLRILDSEIATWEHFQSLPESGSIAALLQTVPTSLKVPASQIFRYVVWKVQERFRPSMSLTSFGVVSFGRKDGVNWIRTDSLFITVISKEHEPATIPGKLLTALEAWDPAPHRLIISKMRAELSAHGGGAETEALQNRHLQVAWLTDLLNKYEPQRRTNVRQDMVRHWENLGSVVWPGVLRFSNQLADFLAGQPAEELIARFDLFKVNAQQEAVHLHLNRYICSKAIEGHHLSTGHVFKFENGQDPEYWLCLSPACDLEPGQGADKGWKKQLGDWMPFKAVRLYCVKPIDALNDSTRGYNIFLQIDGVVVAFGFAVSNIEKESVPTLRWEQFFGKDKGNFSATNETELKRVGKFDGINLGLKPMTAKIVGQLRYEYAISLLQRLGSHLSRVGLDFRNYSAPK